MAIVVYTLNLEMHRKKITPYFMKRAGLEDGSRVHKIKASLSLVIGAATNGGLLALRGVFDCFINSFKASARGCGSPMILTLLGPFRTCI